jgi:hypothetical protein
VLKVLQDLRVLREPKVLSVLKVHKDHKVTWVLKGRLELKGLQLGLM